MKTKCIFWLFFSLAIGLQAHTKNVVFLDPALENLVALPKGYNSLYIVNKDLVRDNELTNKMPSEAIYCKIKDDNDEPGMNRCMDKLRENYTIHYLVDNGTDRGVALGGKLRTKFGISFGMKAEKAGLFMNKKLMKERITEANHSIRTARYVPVPKEHNYRELASTIRDNLGYPVIMKIVDGCGCDGVYRVDSREELNEVIPLLNSEEEYIVEEYISGTTLRIDGYTMRGKTQVIYPAIYEPSCYEYYKIGKAQITYTDFDRLQEYKIFTQKILKALEYKNGIFHLEAIRSESGRLYFLEIAARPGGDSHYLQKLYNYNYYKIHTYLQVGLAIDDMPIKPAEALPCAVVDCPTLPLNGGTWKIQELHQTPTYDIPRDSNIFFRDIKPKGEIFILPKVPMPFFSMGFTGPKAVLHSRALRDSVSAVFKVQNTRKPNDNLITWPHPYENSKKRPGNELKRNSKRQKK